MPDTCKEVFDSVCAQLAEAFANDGLRFRRSRPRLSQTRGDLTLEMNFWSSHSNIEGDFVCLETLSYVSSKSLAAWVKKTGVGRNGTILSVARTVDNVWGLTTVTELAAKLRRAHWEPMKVISPSGELPPNLPDSLTIIDDSYACWLWMQGRKKEALAVPGLEDAFIAALKKVK